MEDFQPNIVYFICKWCTSAGADLAGTSRMEYNPFGVPVRFYCSSRLDPQHILWAFKNGADGVFVGGCHPGDCHYQDGNYKTRRRILLLKRLLSEYGIESDRLQLQWISAAEGKKFTQLVDDFTDQITSLGPLELNELRS